MKQSKRRFPRFAAVAAAVVCAWSASAEAGQRITQLAEDAASTRQIPFSADAPSPTQVCEPGAKWIRLGFKELVLKGYDSLTIRGADGASYTFEGDRWNDRSFSARALEGECVEIRAYFNDPGSRFQLESYQYGAQPLADTPVVVAGAGDICDSSGTVCAGTSDKIIEINPAAVFTAGDNVYTSGTLNEFNTLFNPYWGRFKELINPSPGNHEYGTSGAAGYFDYFNGSGVQAGPAGDRAKGYYSWDIGDWHFIALNSMSGGTVSQTQLDWLTADLAANTKPCTAAYWHHPLISVGNYSPGISQVKPFWDKLYAAHADLVLVGHDHNYQRYALMAPDQSADANGLRQILIGTGGRRFYALRATHPQLEASTDSSFGVLKLTLTSSGYAGEFVRSTGTFTDTFTGTCHNAPPANQPPVADFSYTANGLSVQFIDASHDSDGSITTHAWTFGDGATSSDASPSHTYTGGGSYTVALTVTDNGGLTHTKTTQVTVEGLYRIGGTVSGLAGQGLVLKLNGTDDLPVTSNGAFSFAGGLASGASYAVSVGTQPGTPRQTCVVTNGSGAVAHADVGDVAITCTTATWTVTPAVTTGQGRIQPDVAQTVNDGATATFTLAPAQGWHVAAATGCGGALSGTTYTTAAVTTDCSVEVSFAIDTHVVSASVSAGQGTVTPATQNVDYGATATVTLAPAQGYHAVSASGCGGTLSGTTYTTGPVTADCAVEAAFAIDRHTVSAVVEGGHGTIDPATQVVDSGAAAHVTLTPDAGYVIDTIGGDCTAGQLDGHAYATGAVQADCTVRARFKLGDADVIFRNGFES